jgi:hypothetical protein
MKILLSIIALTLLVGCSEKEEKEEDPGEAFMRIKYSRNIGGSEVVVPSPVQVKSINWRQTESKYFVGESKTKSSDGTVPVGERRRERGEERYYPLYSADAKLVEKYLKSKR